MIVWSKIVEIKDLQFYLLALKKYRVKHYEDSDHYSAIYAKVTPAQANKIGRKFRRLKANLERMKS